MAKTPENALGLLEMIWPSAIGRVAEEVSDIAKDCRQGSANYCSMGLPVFMQKKVRQTKYNLDSDEIKQYLQLNQTH